MAAEASDHPLPTECVPYRCLLPSDVAAELAKEGLQDISGSSGAEVKVLSEDDVPCISDRLVVIEGDIDSQGDACRQIIQRMRKIQGVGDEEEAMFVVLIPREGAPAVIGRQGHQIQALREKTGASISVSREVLEDLDMQPVTAKGSVTQVVAALAGVHEFLLDMVKSGRLKVRAVPMQQLQRVDEDASEEMGGTAEPLRTSGCAMAPVSLVLSMEAAGRVIGKQGKNIQELQQETGAQLVFADRFRSLPGLRCGERLLDISSSSTDSLAAGVQAVLTSVHDLEAGSRGRSGTYCQVVPVDCVPMVVGKGGRSIAEIAEKSGAEVVVDTASPDKVGFRMLKVSGDVDGCRDAMLLIAAKLAEWRAKNGRTPEWQRGAWSSLPESERASHSAAGAARGHPRDSWEAAGAARPSRGSSQCWIDTRAEQELVQRLSACGIMEHRLTMRVPASVVDSLPQVADKSGAVLEVGQEDRKGHCLVTAVGNRMATCFASYYIQDVMRKGV